MRFARRRRFGTKAAVTSAEISLPRKSKCAECKQPLVVGELVLRLRLKKAYQVPCTGCGHKPSKLKFFHPACAPDDINKAMGHDPAVAAVNVAGSDACAPPAKPKTIESLDLAALVALASCVVARAARKGVTPENEKAFQTFQNIKARVLRPGTPGEGEVATSIALQRIIKMVFAD